jgi:pimeloyl-ACP methyl ester carboxylesterase
MTPLFVLVYSPLVGPLTWRPVADALRRRSVDAIVPVLNDRAGGGSYWQQHADAAARALADVSAERPLVLVGHSGAGTLLPLIRQRLPHPVQAYLFVDAGLPLDGLSRLGEMEVSGSAFGAPLRALLEAGGHYPEWTEEILRPAIPNDDLRRGLIAELQPRGFDFFTEQFPPLTKWPDAPCACIQFTDSYDAAIAQARRLGWLVRRFDNAGHFHMLVDPDALADALVACAAHGSWPSCCYDRRWQHSAGENCE